MAQMTKFLFGGYKAPGTPMTQMRPKKYCLGGCALCAIQLGLQTNWIAEVITTEMYDANAGTGWKPVCSMVRRTIESSRVPPRATSATRPS